MVGLLLLALVPTSIAAVAVPGSSSPTIAPATVHWSMLTPTIHPSARTEAASTYDAKDGYVLLFGGRNASSHPLGDTWTYVGGSWKLLTFLLNASVPSARYGASMVFDAKAGYTLLFGGRNAAQTFNDTWKFAGGKWTQLHPATVPTGRYLAVAAYDAPTQSVVIGGGATLYGNLSDMWSFHGGTWTSLNVTPRIPLHGRYSALTYDPRDGYALYYGGTAGFGGNQSWSFASGSWTQLTPTTSPPALFEMDLAFDPMIHHAVLFGEGSSIGGPSTSVTWKYAGGAWTNITFGSQPSARTGASMVYDAMDGYVLLFGGAAPAGAVNSETWTLH